MCEFSAQVTDKSFRVHGGFRVSCGTGPAGHVARSAPDGFGRPACGPRERTGDGDGRRGAAVRRPPVGTKGEPTMTKRSLKFPAVVAAALGLAGTAAGARAADVQQSQPASPPPPSTADLMRQVEQLQSKLQQLESAQQQHATTSNGDAMARLTNDTVERVLRDANKRSQL